MVIANVVLQKRATRSQEEGRLTQFIFLSGRSAVSKSDQNSFKWRHSHSEVILLCIRWYLRYALSYRNLKEMMKERNLTVDHTTIYRWVQRYAPELDKRSRPHLRPTNDSYRVDETYVKVKGQWRYLYRAVDCTGQTIDFCVPTSFLQHNPFRCLQ